MIKIEEQVIYGALVSLAQEIGHKLKRSSYSSVIRESDDYGAAIISSDFELLAEAKTTPLQMGPLAGYCRGLCEVINEKGKKLEPDTVYLHNDSYYGASHSPDIGVILPIFIDDELFAFIGNAAHHIDLGGAVPGTCIIEAHDTFSEGIRLRACPIEKGGELIEGTWEFIQDNVRMPGLVMGDLKAQIAACRWGERSFHRLLKKYGAKKIKRSTIALLNISEMQMKDAISKLPDGVYTSKGYLDGYENTENVDIPIHINIKIKKGTVNVDFSGSARQLEHKPINMPFIGTTDMAVLLTLRTLLLPENKFPNLPHNSGVFRPITITAPKGTIVNPEFPAPTIGRFCAGQLVSNLIVKALSSVLPDDVCAGCSSTKAITFSGLKNGAVWIYMDITEGAYGGMKGMNGLDAVDVLYANTKNNPIEDIESHYPLLIEKYELRNGSEGDGKWKGGRGPIRVTRILQDGYVSVEGDGFRHKPWGILGGKDGSTGGVEVIDVNGSTQMLSSKINNLYVRKGTTIVDICPSGGGYGK